MQIDAWAENCPENFENRAALVGAEIARIEGRDIDAMRLYEQAIRSARDNGFVHNEATAYERASAFYRARGFEDIAHLYLRKARYCYLRWGALGKVRQIDQSYAPLYEERASSSSVTTIGTPVAQLDVGTVVKASQAVSSEIVLDKLIEALMRIAVEHAGAERGVLIVPRGNELQIEAEARTARGVIEVVLRHTAIDPADLPESVLHYVIRTRESVVSPGCFSRKPVFQRRISGAEANQIHSLPAHRQTSQTRQSTLSGKQSDRGRVHVGSNRSAGGVGLASGDLARARPALCRAATGKHRT
jgi:hypothetical protein